MQLNVMDIGHKVFTQFVPFLFALCFHELAHGLVAKWRGDNTAQMMGRLTMNPLVHMDFIGTFVLPMMAILFPQGMLFFGWAKPVPVNSRNLKNPRVDMFWIALAGPASNILLAVVSALLMWLLKHDFATGEYTMTCLKLLSGFIAVNLFLAVFNIIPLNPLDGGKVLARFLPASVNYRLEQNEHITSMILLALFLLGAMSFLVIPVSYLHTLLVTAALG